MSAESAVALAPRRAPPDACKLQVLPDDQLLTRFFQSRDDRAFAVLVRRYGPLVYGVCRRVLADANDAEDAFQATFLVLVRKGGMLRSPKHLANWLYGVAYRTARKAKAKAAQRCKSEREAGAMLRQSEVSGMTYQELSEILDEEISQLPEKYAVPLVLCYLEGRTNAQAASHLGLPEGSMSRRLSRARELLRARLTRRGLAVSVVLIASVFSRPATARVPQALVETTARAASLVAQGVSINEVVAPRTAELVHQMVLGITAAGKLTLSAAMAVAAVLLALTVIVRQVGAPAFGAMTNGQASAQSLFGPTTCGHAVAPAESAAGATPTRGASP